ncbi:hypothetical protein ICN11_04095 [Polynucleobacter sp. 78F-HAINBA]|uniref:hypothetical protein n=1 Tax=Polynucleobacter sp. 78F-HAINBA TaxID=2689099 RepID=UPI001C0B5A29|nr:hypothetical protein [Polynucleobacter sp. 78F-HAINBA]MBU3591197.1 hypothetical protein [Polynucleobacter sp. 78F-HAINBA]
MTKIKSLKELNERHESFWQKKVKETEQWAEKYPHNTKETSEIIGEAADDGNLHNPKKIDKSSFYIQMEKAQLRRNSDNAARAQGPRGDTLDTRIKEIISTNPEISEKDLLSQLKSEAGSGGSILEVDETDIIYSVNGTSKEKNSPISGLKSRLSRAKKQHHENMLKIKTGSQTG